ncbi:MAG: single-stranded-DNA-specific exonuclease RecJ [Bacteroidales bacterium]|nr:single-stranded-DNA-specific exonuclease RecJ [Bacteroidales bacterium]
MERVWTIKKYEGFTEDQVADLQQQMNNFFDIHLTKMLASRIGFDLEKVRQFLRPNLSQLHDPYLFNDMHKAVDRLCQAIENNERILVYGDYDVDGTTSVALVYSFLKEFYKNIDYYIPDRYTEGYGVSFKGVDYAASTNCKLIIALDCGIKDNARIEYAAYKQIDFIVCDHHTPGTDLPKAVAVLDAKRTDNTYPFNELSGCGVGFKFMQAFAIKQNIPFERLLKYIDLTAVSIGSDIVPIVDENRILAYFGLKKLNSQEFKYKDQTMLLEPLTCFKAIMKDAGLNKKDEITIYDSVFMIGPRINAAGRIENGTEAVKLLVTEEMSQAEEFSKKISEYNEDRKNKDHDITEKALEMLRNDPKNDTNTTTVVYGDNWHKGVVGIVASRLTENYYRPTIVLSHIDGKLTGSARSVSDFNLYDAIDSCRKYLTAFGGHKFAAGLNLKVENYQQFRDAFEDYVSKHITKEQQHPKIEIEQYIDFKSITMSFYEQLKQFEPFGPENPEPIFATQNVVDMGSRIVGKDKSHLRLEVMDETGATKIGIAFGMADYLPQIKTNKPFKICYTLALNDFNGHKSVQLMVKDIKFD